MNRGADPGMTDDDADRGMTAADLDRRGTNGGEDRPATNGEDDRPATNRDEDLRAPDSDGDPREMNRDEQRRLMLIAALTRAPETFDFYQALRRLEAGSPRLPRLGEARRPVAEPVRLAQEAELGFAASNVTRLGQTAGGIPRVFVRFLGLFGPQGALPLHLTEFARDRERNHGDAALVRFADMFHHRLLLMFYRAWRQAQPTATHDRPSEDRYRAYVGALFGHGSPSWYRTEPDLARTKRYFAGLLGRSVRNPEGLAAILADYFQVPVTVKTFSPRWLPLARAQRSSLGGVRPANTAAGFRGNDSAILGQGAILGSRVLDAQHHFDIDIGPLDHARYLRLLPCGDWFASVRDWVREYCAEEFGVRLVPQLEAAAVPESRLGQAGRLGWDTWLGRRRSQHPAGDLSLNVAAATSVA